MTTRTTTRTTTLTTTRMTTSTETGSAAPDLRAASRTASRTASRSVIAVRLDGGRVRVDARVDGPEGQPGLRPMIVSTSAETACVSLVPDGALLLADDAIELDVHVGSGACLELIEPAGTVAYDMRGGSATWDVEIRLEPGATLIWRGEPFVISSGASVRRRQRIVVGEGSRLLVREVLVLGRHGESAGSLDQRLDVVTDRDEPLLIEQLTVDAESVATLLGGRALGSVLARGLDPGRLDGFTRMELESGASLFRRIADEAHLV